MVPVDDYDGPWKEALETYLEAFLAFCFPLVHEGIAWSANYQWQDRELQLVAPDSERGSQAVDKLVEVRRRDGSDAWVLIHLEVQSQRDRSFAERMYRYHARLYDRHRRPIVSLAVLGDTRSNWWPAEFGYDLWGCTLRLTFPAVKLLDYDLATLEASTNPCATVILAHRTAQATRDDPTERARAKLNLSRRLYHLGYDRVAIQRLYRFIDWLLQLPEALETETWQAIRAFEEEQGMTYITYGERVLARERAESRAEGQVQGLLLGIGTALELKFGADGAALLPELRQIDDPARLLEIMEFIKAAVSPEAVRSFAAHGV